MVPVSFYFIATYPNIPLLKLFFMMRKLQTLGFLLTLFFFIGCEEDENEPIQDPTQFTATDFVLGLKMPVGMSIDEKGQLWVAETGTGNKDRKSTRLNSSHVKISYAVFCLKKKKTHIK